MAWIYDKNGQQKCEVKKLSYNGVFMDVSSITVTVESAEPIAFGIGDYIDWDYDGLRYTLDTAAGVEKQARRNSIGNAFTYDNLVFLSPLSAAGNADFLDVVLGNTNDFLTNTQFSFYGTAWDYAKRIEANLCRLYGDGSWKVRIWTNGTCYDESPATGITTGSWENKLVDVSGIKCLGGFKQIYDLWGCAYVFSVDDGVNYVDFYDDFELYAKAWKAGGVDKIFTYGKGNGLYKIRHTADADHVLVTRLRAYGSSDNLPANYYLNSPDYHVDGNESSELAISHLMLPASQWTKDGEKSPANAYLEQNTELYGVREASVYWDGSNSELGEIKPTIYGLTIQDLLDLMASGTTYRPVESKWPDTAQRIDKIITGAAPTDNGAVAEAGYDFTVVEASGSTTANDFGVTRINHDVEFNDLLMGITPSVSHLAEFRIVPTSSNKKVVSFDIPGEIASRVSAVTAYITPYVNGVKVGDATVPCAVSIETISITVSEVLYTKRCNISLLDATENPIVFSTMLTGPVTFRIRASVVFNGEMSSGFNVIRNEYAVSFNLLRGNKAIDKFFSVTIPQVGFDLAAAVSGAAKLCMRSGYNQPREFQIDPSSVRYLSASDTWYLRCKRVIDQSTQTYFPNSDAVIAAGDEYYLAGIAMPSLYVEIAAQKLLAAATAWLDRHSKPRMLSSVDVDNKIMAVEGIVLKEGMSLPLSDADLDITPETQESRVIDNIRIEEGTSSIRTFTITLRDKKEKSSLDAAIRGATSNFATNTSVSEAVSAAENRDHGSLSGRDMPNQHPITAITGLEEALAALTFFEEDGNGNVKLKDEYGGLWADGFMTAGGIGSGGGGGGEGATLLEVWRSLTNNPSLVDSDITPALAIAAAHIPIGNGLTINPQTGLIDATTSGTVISVAGVSPVNGDVPKDSLIDALGLNIVSRCLQSLQSQIDSVASKDDFDELNVTVLHTDMLSASGIYAEAITLGGSDLSTTLNGLSTAIGNEATARANADSTLAGGISTLNGNFTNGAANNAIKLGGQLPSYYATASALSGVSDRLAVLEARQNWDEIFGIDENGDVYIKQYQEGGETKSRGFWGYSFITAGGVGSGGGEGGGASLLEVWRSLTNNPELVDSDITPALNIASLHIPIGNGLVINSQTGLIDVTVRGGVTSVAGMTGDISTAQLATALGISDLNDKLSIISICLQSFQSQIDSVASRNEFDELAATAFHADIITTPLLYAEVVSLNGVDLNTRLVGISADITAEALARASADTTLTGAVNDVASRATALEGRASSLETRATALEGRADSLENKFDANGNAKSALKLTTVSKTIWGQTYWTSGGVPQNVTAAPNLYIGATKVQTSQAAQALIGILSLSAVVSPGETDETKIEWDADAHAWHFHGGLYADSFIVAGGSGSGGGGGSTDLSDMWFSLKTNEDEFANEKIHPDHIPSLSWGKITTGKPTTLLGYGITDAYTKLEVDNLIGAIDQFHYEIYPSLSDITTPAGNVLYLIGPTGSGSDKYEEYVYANGTFTKIGDTTIDLSPYLTIAGAQATYQPIISDLATIRTQAAHGETAYNSLGTISDCIQSLQSQIDSVASRGEFDELTATVLFADMISTPSIYVETLSLNGNDLAGALSNLSSRATSLEGRASSLESRATSLEGRATSLEGKFTGDSANSALRLAGTSAYSIWGVEYWSSGVPKSVTGSPGLFIGSTQVQTSNSPQPLAGITTLTASGLATIAGGISLGGTFEGVDSKIVWDATNSAWHLIGNFYADGFIVAGGTGSGGGGGDVDLDRVWESLTNNTDFPNVKILGTHIPDMGSTYGYLKGNQTITLTGVVTGSGATTIATSIANNALSISMVNGLQAALDSKTSNVGTVTSVGLSMPTGFSVSSSPITASGTLSVSFASGYSLLTSTQISTWNGKQDAIGDLDTIRTNAALGAEANAWGNHASAGYFKASSFTAANIASTLGNTAVNRATADASGENISDKFGIVGVALQSLQSQIDSLASKNAFDELSVTVLNADMVTATTAYLETIYGSLQGNALTASYLYSQSYSAGSPVNPVYFTSGRPAPCSYSFGNASGNAPINNGILNTNLWANYATCDSSNENISDKFGIVSVALQSIQSQVDSVASRDSFDELSATVLHADMLTVGAQVNVGGAIFSDEGIYTNGYLVGGGVVSSSDRRLKDEITKVDAERAWEVLMALNPVEWVWNENNAHLYGRRSAGLVAQEVFDVLPYSVFHDGQYDALRYDVFHAFEIAGLQDHEARIRTLEAENKELKRQVELLTR